MKALKIDILELVTVLLALSGATGVVIGIPACLGGLSGVSIIKLGKVLKPHQPTLQKMMFFGGISVGAGVLSICTSVSIARRMGERAAEIDLVRSQAQSMEKTAKGLGCMGCKHFHGIFYNNTQLICGMYPYGYEGEQCPDWESNEDKSSIIST